MADDDDIEGLEAEESEAMEAWRAEVKRQRANKDAGRAVSGAKMHELHDALERVRERLRAAIRKALGQ